MPAEATSIARVDGQYTVRVGDETSVTAPMVVIAAGARYRRLEVPRTEYFEKVSVYYPASQAEAQLCRGDPAVIVGGGNFAGQAAVFLARGTGRREPRTTNMVDVAVCAGGRAWHFARGAIVLAAGPNARRTAEVPGSLSDRRPAMASLPVRRSGRNQTS